MKSDDFAGDIADLMQLGMAGDKIAQDTIMSLVQKVDAGDERVARMVDDAVSRIKEQRHYSAEEKKDSSMITEKLGELTGQMDNSQPTEREQKLLGIIAKQAAQLEAAGISNGSEGQNTELRPGEESPQDQEIP